MDRDCGVAASLGDGIRCSGRSGSVESDTIHFVVGSLLGMKRGVSVGIDNKKDAGDTHGRGFTFLAVVPAEATDFTWCSLPLNT